MKSEGTYLFFMLVFYSNPRYLYVPSDFMLYSISLLSVFVLFRIVYIFCFCSVLFRIRKKYKQRLSQILRSELNFKNTFKAIKTYAMLVLTYLSGIIKWSNTDLGELNRLNRTQLTAHRKLYPNTCTERITISWKEEGRGFIDIRDLDSKQI